MASQLRFEGAVLEDLLERVRDEVGPDARIIGANRIRKGGVAGFFAREGFEVIVDIAGEDMGGRRRAASRPAAGAGGRRRSARVPASVLDLADEVSGSEAEQVIDLSEPLPVSTESPDFGTMLESLTRELDREEMEMPAPAPGPSAPVIPPVSPRAHYRRVTAEPAPAAPAPAPAPTPAPAPAPAPAPGPAPVTRRGGAAAAVPVPDDRLHALGLPADLVPSSAAAHDLRAALVQRLAQLPPPPMLPRTPGVVVAVVGIGTAPISLARRIADELDADPDHIILATPEPVSDLSHPDQAAMLRRSWRRREEPTVVACSIGAGRAQLGWAHRMLDRLEPTVTWAVVEASCKADDVAHRVALLGGVDVLALTGVADTASPASVLGLGIAVGRLGAKHATPAAWADLLMERLER